MKEAYKDKYFGQSMNFRWHGSLKEGRLSAELAPKSDRSDCVVNEWAIQQEN